MKTIPDNKILKLEILITFLALIIAIMLFSSCKKDDLIFEGMYLQKNTDIDGKRVNVMDFQGNNYTMESYLFTGGSEQGKPVALKAPETQGTIKGDKLRSDNANFDWGKRIRVTDEGFQVYMIFSKKTVIYNKVTPDQCMVELMLK